jgi:hypothetical protein
MVKDGDNSLILLPIELFKRIDWYEIIWQYVLEPECGESLINFHDALCSFCSAAAAEKEKAFY